MEYSPLVGGFAVTLNDGHAAFLTASSLRFDPNVSWLRNKTGINSNAYCPFTKFSYRTEFLRFFFRIRIVLESKNYDNSKFNTYRVSGLLLRTAKPTFAVKKSDLFHGL